MDMSLSNDIGIKSDKLTNSTEQKLPLHIQTTDFWQKLSFLEKDRLFQQIVGITIYLFINK